MKKLVAAFVALIALASCAHHARSGDEADPHLWLEQIEGREALDWVKAHNDKSLGVLEGDARYKRIEREVRKIVLATDRIPMPAHRAGQVYNFWQDAKSVRGLWRRAPLAEYARKKPKWETVIDLDRLAADEKENWVWKGAECLAPDYERCFVALSRGGKDAVVRREFDVAKKEFVRGGFELAEAKSVLAWVDRDTVLVATDFGPDSFTLAGYPRLLKLWKRGTPLAEARQIFEGAKTDDEVAGGTYFTPDGNLTVVVRQKTFYTSETWVLNPATLALERLAIPEDAYVDGYFRGRVLVRLRGEWKHERAAYPAGAFPEGSLLSLTPKGPQGEPGAGAFPRLVFAPDERSSIAGVSVTRDAVLVDVLRNVKGSVLEARLNGEQWRFSQLKLPDDGVVSIVSADAFDDVVLTSYESFLTPTTVFDSTGGRNVVLKQLPARFDARGLLIEQLEAVSRDGTRIPYFVVRRKSLARDGEAPTLLYGYGGFEISMTPSYSGVIGKVWLEKGGVYVLANIRGGGEFGPRWHQAALKTNRQRAYDDFAAVAQDLIARKTTSPAKLGIMGGSNGGLLMGVAFTQHPELYKAVVCKVPLLDMLRYNQLLAGHSWEGEYGDPANPEERAAILGYSPYQRVRADVRYPEVFFETSTKDDRVHPGHARKMVAKMEAQGHPVFYFENTEGGHGAAANLEQKIRMTSLDYTYLSRQLGVH